MIDSFIDHTHCISYFGTHSHDSGFIAGRLMLEQINTDEDIAIFRFSRIGDSSTTQVTRREEGFREYLQQANFKGHIYSLSMHADDLEKNQGVLSAFFKEHPQIKEGIVFNSRAHYICNYLSKECPKLPFHLIGFDVIAPNVRYLEEGLISHLIAQRPEVQGSNCIKALFSHLVLKEKIEPINYMPIDILVKENIKYYNNYI